MESGDIQLEEIKAKEDLIKKPGNDADMLDTVLFHVGDMGLYQKMLSVGMLPFGFFYAFVYFVQMFITIAPQNHWCRVPELANLSMELRRNLSAPGAASGEWDHCMTFDTNWTKVLDTLTPPSHGTPKVPCQHGWDFEFSDIHYATISTERNWVCDRASYVPTAQSIFFIGAVFGGFLFGWMADRFGRVPALIATNVVGGIGGIATIFTSGVWDFIFCRFLVGMSFDNCYMLPYILVLEYVGPQYRTAVGNIGIAIFYGGASVLLPWIAYYIADWRLLLWVTSLPMFLVVLAHWLMPESTRWLISRGHVNRAITVLKRIEKINGTKIPEDILQEFIISSNKANLEKKQSILSLFKSPPMRKTFIGLVVVYLGCAMVFDGLVRMSDSFSMNFFVMFSFNSATEIPSILLVAVILDRLGRRNLTWGPLIICGLCITIVMFISKGIFQSILAITGRFFINICYTTTIQWSIEVLPTPFRATGSSIQHLIGYMATTFTPFIVYSERYWSLLPLLFFALTSYIAAGVSLTMPETKGLQMPQTIADGEKIIREHSLCGKPEDDDEAPYKKKLQGDEI